MWTNYTARERKQEIEANYFACALLMPKAIFIEEWEKLAELQEDERIKKIADVFEVPLFAVVMRLMMITNSKGTVDSNE